MIDVYVTLIVCGVLFILTGIRIGILVKRVDKLEKRLRNHRHSGYDL